jgi:hypothetical protein
VTQKKSVSQFRNNDIARDHWMNSFSISGLKNKIGLIRAVCYSKQQDKFYFFAIPYKAYKGMNRVDILLDSSSGYQEPQGIPKGKWTRYMKYPPLMGWQLLLKQKQINYESSRIT